MGIDLKVFASQFRERPGEWLATATLRLERDNRLLAQLSPDSEPCLVKSMPAGLKVGHHEDDGLRWDEVDGYRKPLTFTTPAELRRLRLPEDLHPWNLARIMHTLGQQQRVEEHKAIDCHDLCRSITIEQRKQTALAGTGRRTW
jgi:hypothetical protein